MSQNNPNWVPPWHSPSLTPSQCFSLSRKTFFGQKERGEGEKKWERPLYLLSVLFSSLFMSSPLHPVCSPPFPVSPLPLPFFQSSQPSSSLLSLTTCHPLLSLILSLPLSVPVLLPPSSSWVDSGRWLISWRNSSCPHGTVVSWNWLLGASRLGDLRRCSAGLQGIWKSLWYRHQVLVYVQDLRRSCGQHKGVCIGKTGRGYSLPMVCQHLSGSRAPESYSRNYRHSLPVLRTGWDELHPEKEGLCPISPQCKAGPGWIEGMTAERRGTKRTFFCLTELIFHKGQNWSPKWEIKVSYRKWSYIYYIPEFVIIKFVPDIVTFIKYDVPGILWNGFYAFSHLIPLMSFFEACITNLILGVTKVFKSTFVGLPVIKTLPCNAEGVDSIPGQGAEIPHTLEPNIKQEQYCNKFNKRL